MTRVNRGLALAMVLVLSSLCLCPVQAQQPNSPVPGIEVTCVNEETMGEVSRVVSRCDVGHVRCRGACAVCGVRCAPGSADRNGKIQRVRYLFEVP